MAATDPNSILADEITAQISAALSLSVDAIVRREYPDNENEAASDGALIVEQEAREVTGGEWSDSATMQVEHDFEVTLWSQCDTDLTDGANACNARRKLIIARLHHHVANGHPSPLATSGTLPLTGVAYPSSYAFCDIGFGSAIKVAPPGVRDTGLVAAMAFTITVTGLEVRA